MSSTIPFKHAETGETMTSVGSGEYNNNNNQPPEQVLQNTTTTIHRLTPPSNNSFSAQWTSTVHQINAPVIKGLYHITHSSALHPKKTIAAVVIVSISILIAGLFTGFVVEDDEDVLWTPKNSVTVQHQKWIDTESGFPSETRALSLIFHQSGNTDIIGQDQVKRIFQVFDLIRSQPNYDTICMQSANGHCPVSGVVKFWNQSSTVYDKNVQNDDDLIEQISSLTYSDGTPVAENEIFGKVVRDKDTNNVIAAQSYIVLISLPEIDDTEDLEKNILDDVLALRDEWVSADPTTEFRVEITAERSFSDEFDRAIVKDIPLVPIVFIIMGLFTSAVFFQRDPVNSRSLLGFTAVLSVLLSIMAGYGLMFVAAIPFTSMTQILPFVFFGVGLDDAFIITGEYLRLDPTLDAVSRIDKAIESVGLSVFLTTLTSSLAFGLGCTSNIPAVYWLCLYGCPTFALILLFQLTFFVACIVLDENRIKARNRDCFRCCNKRQVATTSGNQIIPESVVDRFMVRLTEKLLQPWVKVVVIVATLALTGACAYSTSKLKQEFKLTDVLPSDSYITDFYNSYKDYTIRGSVAPYVYFRNVDQSDPMIQNQMEQYVNDLVDTDAIESPPDFFWLWDFKKFIKENNATMGMSFIDQMDAFMANPVYNELYSEEIVRDASGMVTASRCLLYMDNVDEELVKEQIDALKEQEDVSEIQPINEKLSSSEFSFFTYHFEYNTWAFYDRTVYEIITNTLLGVIAVTAITLIFIPHWTASIIAMPFIIILYVDMLGLLQWAGVTINAVTYVTLIMSIGLLIDYIMHVLLQYYEAPGCRAEKVQHILKNMGSSILLGAITTFLGTLPLAFSTSNIFQSIFIAFIALVALGATHGLIVLPVVLSIFGPEDQILSMSSSGIATKSNEEQPAIKALDKDSNEGSYAEESMLRSENPPIIEYEA